MSEAAANSKDSEIEVSKTILPENKKYESESLNYQINIPDSTGLFLAIMTEFNAAEVVLFKVGFAASFAAKLADTFGSEIGKRFGKDTYLITSLKKVERGTEGGISIEGTLASIFGAIFMAFIMLRLSIISTKYHFIVVAVSGFLATISESIIGAKFQNKYKLSNELVNVIQTSIASVFAIFFLILYSYFLN